MKRGLQRIERPPRVGDAVFELNPAKGTTHWTHIPPVRAVRPIIRTRRR
jgi:hypothetical protein